MPNRGKLSDPGTLAHISGSTFWQAYLKLVITVSSVGSLVMNVTMTSVYEVKISEHLA